MMPLKYSNFLVAVTAVLPDLCSPFVAPVYVIISLAFLYSNGLSPELSGSIERSTCHANN